MPEPGSRRSAQRWRSVAAVLSAAVLSAACGSNGTVELSAASAAAAAEFDSAGSGSAGGAAPEPTDPSAAGSGSGSGGDGSGSADGGEGAAGGGETGDGDGSAALGNGESPSREEGAAAGSADGGDDAAAGEGVDNVSGDAAEPIAGPENRPAGPTAPLTGLLTSDFSLAERRALAVKVDNANGRARPQVGLGSADVVYEALIEGGKTRFLAVFHSNIPALIGPVRSARSTDIDLVADLGAPYLASSGANNGVLGELRRAHNAGTLVDIGGLRTATVYTRVDDRPAPYNFFLQYPSLEEGAPASAQPLFEYGSNPPDTENAAGVTVAYHGSSVASHVWDAGLGGWVRIQDGKLHTVTGAFGPSEVAPANVAVVFVAYSTSTADRASPKAESFGSGDALVLTAGSVYRGRWERTADRPGFRFTDASGSPLGLSPGSTWVLLANTSGRFPVSRVTMLTVSEGADLLAEARAAAEAAGNDSSAS